MPKGQFEKVEKSDKRMHGPRKLIVCGYNGREPEAVRILIAEAGLDDLSVIYASTAALSLSLKELCAKKGDWGWQEESQMPRAMVMSGFTENELHGVMGLFREMGFPSQLWATLTPLSENWPLGRLLAELDAERVAMASSKK